MTEKKGVIYEFGRFVLDPDERTLHCDGEPTHLSTKLFKTLLLLVESEGRLLTKDEMMFAVWGDLYVEEANLAKNISRLRKVLKTEGAELIETLPGHGYRFLADVRTMHGAPRLVLRRNLRIKVTETVDEESPESTRTGSRIESRPAIQVPGRLNNSRVTAMIGLALIVAATIAAVAFQSSTRGENNTPNSEYEPVRLTDHPLRDSMPRWTSDGSIRFFRFEKDRRIKSWIMNADGTGQRLVNDFAGLENGLWSPDGKKVYFSKPGEYSHMYLANADGTDEIALPFAGNADWSADGRMIVYHAKVNETDSEINVYSLETGAVSNVTNHPTFDADPSFSPDGKQIVFVSMRDGNGEIYLMNVDGSDVRRLTNHPAWDSHPVFSPDGTTIAFSSERLDENSGVFLMDTNGGDVRRLTDWESDEWVEPGCWSSDGTRIAFVSDRSGGIDIYTTSAEVYRPRLVIADDSLSLSSPTYSPDGKQILHQSASPDKVHDLSILTIESGDTRVIQRSVLPGMAAFSPDGSTIVFEDKDGSNSEIYSIRADGSSRRNLTNNPARDGGASFSPDGRQIAFSSNRGENWAAYHLFVMNADGSDQRRIYAAPQGMSITPTWSPDGTSIFFSTDKEDGVTGNFEIFRIESNGVSGEQRLTFRPGYDTNPAVSPDGRYVTFASNGDGNWEIYLMNSDGSGLRRLTRNAASDTTPQFSRDGQRIIFTSDRLGKFAVFEIPIVD